MGSSGNLSKLVIPKQHWQEGKDKAVYMNVGYKEMGPDSRGFGGLQQQQQQQQQVRSKVMWWLVFSLCAGLVVVPFLMVMCAIDNIEAMGSNRHPWISLDGPPLEFIGVHWRWSLLRGSSEAEMVTTKDFSGETKPRAALQGMGTLLRVGTKAMQELVVAHLTEDTSSEDLRLFLRSLHRSGTTARADVVLLFPGGPIPSTMGNVIQEEEDSFQKLLVEFEPKDGEEEATASQTDDSASADATPSIASFNATAFKRRTADETQQDPSPETIWGRRQPAPSSPTTDNPNPDTITNPITPTSWASYGSIVSFDTQELDPQDALQGFFDTPPVQLRRWICHDMLLGMVKSRYKNVLVSQVKGVYILGDALSVLRKKPTLYLTAEDLQWRDATQEFVTMATISQPEVETTPTVVDLPSARYESIRRSLRESSKVKVQGEVAQLGLMQSVYGLQMWKTLAESDKERVVVSSAVIMGGVQFVRGLASKMTSEIVRVAMERKSRRHFHDKAVINMWVHKKAALGKRIADHLKVVKNQDSVVQTSIQSLPSSLRSVLPLRKQHRYLVVHDREASALRLALCTLDSRFYQRCL